MATASSTLAVWCTYAPWNYNEVIIFLGNGNGTFTYSNTYTAPNAYANPGSNSLYVADFNGDGKLDLAALAPYCASNLPVRRRLSWQWRWDLPDPPFSTPPLIRIIPATSTLMAWR